MKTLHPLLLAAGVVLTAATLQSQEATPAPDNSTYVPGPNTAAPDPGVRATGADPLTFENLDADGDGRLVLDEFTAPAAKARQVAGNTDRVTGLPGPNRARDDGIVSPTDTLEGRYSPEVFKNLDVDHDNSLSRSEFEALGTNAHNISQP